MRGAKRSWHIRYKEMEKWFANAGGYFSVLFFWGISVDALMMAFSEVLFIEFKNGNMKSEKAAVKNKVRDSLLLFCDITQKNIEYTRRNMKFILVYNGSKNCPSRSLIAKHISEKANEPFISFGMEIFKGLYFKEVCTYTELEFDQYLNSI